MLKPMPKPLNAVLRDLSELFLFDLGLVELDGDFTAFSVMDSHRPSHR